MGTQDRSKRYLRRRVTAVSGAAVIVAGGTLGFAGIASAAYPNVNALIAFTSTRDNGGPDNLFTVNPAQATGTGSSDQTAVKALTNSSGDDDGAFYSPSGQTVVFFSDRNTNGSGDDQIWTVPAANVPTTEDMTGTSPAADGASLYFSDPGHDDTWPSFAPNGHTIAFNQDDGSVIVVDPTAASPTEINATDPGDPPANNGRAVFDPVDSTKLVYADSAHHLMLVSGITPGGTLTFTDLSAATINGGADEFPDFSPDGTHIVFDSTRPVTGGTSGQHQIWVIGTDGSNPSPFFTSSTGTPASTGYSDVEPAFSPDGTKITFSRSNNGKDIYATSAPANGDHAPTTAVTDLSLTLTGSPIDIDPDWEGVAATPPASVPESPWAIGMPLAAAALIGWSYRTLRRRPRQS